MGAWNPGIFDNDISMDVVCEIENKYNEYEDFDKAIKLSRTGFWNGENETELAIVSAEMFNGSKIDRKTVDKVLDEELSEERLKAWVDDAREVRKNILTSLKEDILKYKEKKTKPTAEEIRKWIKEKHENDIL